MFEKLRALLWDIKSYKENRRIIMLWILFFVLLPILDDIWAKKHGTLSDTAILSGIFGRTIVGLCWLVSIIKRLHRTKKPDNPELPAETGEHNDTSSDDSQ